MMFVDQSAINAHYDTAHAKPDNPNAKFKCDICGKKVSSKSVLKQHMATAHGQGDVKTFHCDLCQFVCNNKSNLNRHFKKAHCPKL